MNDPMLGAIISCLQASYYQELKKKGRIFVADSANLLGVVDQTGTLGPNEVFLQVKRNQKDSAMTQFVNRIIARNKES